MIDYSLQNAIGVSEIDAAQGINRIQGFLYEPRCSDFRAGYLFHVLA